MMQMRSILDVADNSGARKIAVINPIGGSTGRFARIGDIVTASVKEAIVAETLMPGTTVTAVARRHGIDRGLLYRWRQELKVCRSDGEATLVPVDVSMATPGGGRIEVELPDGVRIRVDAPVDTVALSQVLRALGR